MKEYTTKIVNWYEQNKRLLPWRESPTPYHVWISEIMLQQTRIESVKNYYDRFIKEVPDIQTLATISEEKLLKLWEGLGYYTRAKNLKQAAIKIIEDYQGKFPTTYIEILKLPGIGEYTASAISSICFNEKQITIDGNVLRVYTRLKEDYRLIDNPKTKKEIQIELLEIIPEESGSFNQGLMEIGETICIPNGIPKCNICPLKDICKAKQNKTYQSLPAKSPKKDKPVESYTILLYNANGLYAIYKRTSENLLNNLWAFPNIPQKFTTKQLEEYLKKEQISYQNIKQGPTHTHIFTHKKWFMTSYIIKLNDTNNLKNYQWVSLSEIKNTYCIPTAYKPFIKELEQEQEQ